MINLLPKAYKAEILAARTNVILIRYSIIIMVAFAFLVLIIAGSLFLLNLTKQGSEDLIAANAAKAAEYSETNNEIKELATNLDASKAVLNNQISYSKVLTTIAAALPKGTIIGELELTDASFDGKTATNLTIYAVDNATAEKLAATLPQTPGFSTAKVDTINNSTVISGYPVSAQLTVTLDRSVGR